MELVLSSIIAFVGTNIDDIFVLMLFFANKSYKTSDVVLGQYLGISALIAIGFIGSFAVLFVDKMYIGLLGFLPFYLGIKSLISLRQETEDYQQVTRQRISVFSVAAVTIANGGDNIGIYIPLFATRTLSEQGITIIIFLVMVAMWCWIGYYLIKHPIVAKVVDKYGHMITPVVLILLGCYILYESGTYHLLELL